MPKFINIFIFMLTLLSSLVENISEIYKEQCKLSGETKKKNKKKSISSPEDNKLSCKCTECKKDC